MICLRTEYKVQYKDVDVYYYITIITLQAMILSRNTDLLLLALVAKL